MRRFAVTARLKPDVQARAAELIAQGPPFDLATLGFYRHEVYLSHGEVVFVFEGREIEWALDELVNEEAHSLAFREWRPLLEGIPRLAREHFRWESEEVAPWSERKDGMKKILIATDGSPAAAEAVDLGLELASEQRAEVVLLHVVPPTDFRVTRVGPPHPVPHRLEITDEDTALHEAAEKATARGVAFQLELISGEAADEIVTLAEAVAADLVVVGSRGRGAIAGALLGSVSKAVLSQAKRPVLVVRGTRAPLEAAV